VSAHRWEKLGLVMDLRKIPLPRGYVSHAQSPQVLQFKDFLRIYFSTRSVDSTGGKFRSHICYAEVAPDLRSIKQVSQHEIVPLGALGSFDEHGIFPMNVLRVGDEVRGYTTGWNRRVSVSVDTAIGLVASKDNGVTFERTSAGPILGPSLHEPFLVGDAFVQVHEGLFHMWYIFGTHWKRYAEGLPPERIYKIGHTTSVDGIHWLPSGGRQLVADAIGADECQALPSVVQYEGRHHMFFCFREANDFRSTRGRGYRLGHAYSDNLIDWTRDDSFVPPMGVSGEWDAEMQCYPHAFVRDGQLTVLYNGNRFGADGFGAAVLK
jgi:hypothetical protein